MNEIKILVSKEKLAYCISIQSVLEEVHIINLVTNRILKIFFFTYLYFLFEYFCLHFYNP
jgi:hypothetical protein